MAKNTPQQARSTKLQKQAEAHRKEAEAVELRKSGASYYQIAERVGYGHAATAKRAVDRALAREPTENAAQLKQLMLVQLQDLYLRTMQVLARRHPMVSHGKVVFIRDTNGDLVRDDQGRPQPVDDDGVKLAAVRELRATQESMRRLLGLDAPQRVRVDYVPEEAVDEETRQLVEALGGPAAVADLERAWAAAAQADQ